jgi:hypothetical protein
MVRPIAFAGDIDQVLRVLARPWALTLPFNSQDIVRQISAPPKGASEGPNCAQALFGPIAAPTGSARCLGGPEHPRRGVEHPAPWLP